MVVVHTGLLATSDSLSTAAILAGLIAPGSRRVVRLPEVERRDVSELRADLYLPPRRTAPGIVLVVGALREGRRYELLEATARSLAACGYAVLVPELGRLRRLILGQDALEDLVRATSALCELEGVRRGPVGLFGFSLGGSLALLAAGDGRLRDRVACVACMGGYFRLIDMLTAATTGVVGAARETVRLESPSVYAVCASLVASLPEGDRHLLEQALEERPEAPLEAIAGVVDRPLGPEAHALQDLLGNRDPAAVPGLVRALNGMASIMSALSPEMTFARLEVPVSVLHDERDRYVPSQQSQLMRQAAAGRTNFRFFNTRLLEHTEPTAPSFHPARLFGDYLPGLGRMARFVRGSLAAVRKASAPLDRTDR